MREIPSNYLEQHLEPLSNEGALEEQPKAYERLDSPLAAVEYKDAGTVEIKTQDLEIAYTYEPKRDEKYLKVLKSFSLTNPHTGNKLSLEEILPPDYRVVFTSQTKQIGKTGSFHDEYSKEISVDADFAKLFAILDLLHEIGHAVLKKNLSDADKFKLTQSRQAFMLEDLIKISPEQLEMVLKNERSACAFALAKIKPFLNNSNLRREDVLEYLHGKTALSSYSDEIRKRMIGNE